VYERFFHLESDPFGVSPDPRFFFPSAQHVEAAAALQYAVDRRRGFAALVAAPGLGKTTVITTLLERLRGRADIVLLVNPRVDENTLVQSVLAGFGAFPDPDPAKRLEQLATHLSNADRDGRTSVIIFDEAQNLSAQSLETLRMLSNFESPDRKLLQIILVGQPSLAALLKRPECRQIEQRINVVARLMPLGVSEVKDYVRHRWVTAGGAELPFSLEALELIATASEGIPRVVNKLCFAALTVAFADTTREITTGLVEEVIGDLRLEEHDESPAIAVLVPTVSNAQPEIRLPSFMTAQAVTAGRNTAVVTTIILALAAFVLWTVSTTGPPTRQATPAPVAAHGDFSL
jgi:general secretion pathway protein A